MVYVCLAEAAVLAVVVITFASVLRWQARDSARRELLHVNQLLHAAGHAWQPAPADLPAPSVWGDELEPEPRSWTATPEQEPVY